MSDQFKSEDTSTWREGVTSVVHYDDKQAGPTRWCGMYSITQKDLINTDLLLLLSITDYPFNVKHAFIYLFFYLNKKKELSKLIKCTRLHSAPPQFPFDTSLSCSADWVSQIVFSLAAAGLGAALSIVMGRGPVWLCSANSIVSMHVYNTNGKPYWEPVRHWFLM